MELEFRDIKEAVERQMAVIMSNKTFRTSATKEELWDTYLGSFPEGTNPIFRERTEHDCSCCKQFVRGVGNMVAIVSGELVTIWDIEIGGPYQVVADAMAALVKSKPIENIFMASEPRYGADKTYEQDGSRSIEWNHFFAKLPNNMHCKGESLGTYLGKTRSSYDVFSRALREITTEAVTTVQELIAQNSLYRGEEHLYLVDTFNKHQRAIASMNAQELEFYAWLTVATESDAILHIRNSVIGTLLVDLSEDMPIEVAVKKFEDKVAPTNYKRPTALITKGMIEKAQAKVAELGFEASLHRRYAVTEDITINNVLFADREAAKKMNGNVFDELKADAVENVKSYDKVEEININDFIKDVLPKAKKVAVLFENKHANNLVSLIAPEYLEAPGMFKWHNNFSWAYAGEVTDSIKQRVKNAGGNVEGDFRASLSWFNYDDLDLHMIEPSGTRISFRNKRSSMGGGLDVDMNAGSGDTRSAVENITYPDRAKMREGTYTLIVNQFAKRETKDVGFEVEIEFDGVVHTFVYQKAVKSSESIEVAKFKYTHANGIEFIQSLPSTMASKEMWGISTQQFVPVEMIMFSPNHWDEKVQGNKHYFFMLKECLNDGDARGFFNEFLVESLNEHRKVFEVLGSKMKAQHSDNQLSGLGFSSTQRNSLVVKVTGAMERVVKVIF